MCDAELIVWCGSFPSPHPANQTANVAAGLHKVKIGAVAVGCAEWCEAHQLVCGLKNFDARKTGIYNLLEERLSEHQGRSESVRF